MIEDLVPDLAICQEAKKKGVVIESSFWWGLNDDNNFELCQLVEGYLEFKNGASVKEIWLDENDKYISAPLTDEILKVLPEFIIKDGLEYFLVIHKNKINFFAGYATADNKNSFYEIDKKLSNALLLLAIELKSVA